MSRFGGPRPLKPEDDTGAFSSGNDDLDQWLKARALKAERAQTAKTYVITDGFTEVVGYYCLSSCSISHGHVGGGWLTRNTPDPVPVVLLGRLAIDTRFQGAGLGSALLKDATLKAASAAEVIGARALVVHAIDERAADFYRQYGFAPVPANPLHMYAALSRAD